MIFKITWLSKIWIALGSFPVVRGTADRESLRICAEVIESGQPLVLFPEGTRQSGPVVQELFDGVAYLAGKTPKKLGEEMAELLVACADEDRARAAEEGADVVYHLLVALRSLDVGLDDLRAILARRSRARKD